MTTIAAVHTAALVLTGVLLAAATSVAAYYRTASPGRHRIRQHPRDLWHTPGWQPGELAAIAVRLAEDRAEITAPITYLFTHQEARRG